jgi:hypothetical protein
VNNVQNGPELYVFRTDGTRESSQALLQTFGRYASDPQLSFTWYDAAICSQKVRKMNRDADGA